VLLYRLIIDNVLLAYELTHHMHNKMRGVDGYAALKLDMSKAYDCVEWDFLRQMLIKLGFHHDWLNVAMKFVSTVSYRVKVNGELTDVITPQRGLRQGDPLSPYLTTGFRLFAKCLTRQSPDYTRQRALGSDFISKDVFAECLSSTLGKVFFLRFYFVFSPSPDGEPPFYTGTYSHRYII
jgi:hypothetical protein